MALNALDGGIGAVVVEVAGHHDMGMGRQPTDGVDGSAQPVGHPQTVRSGSPLTTIAAGRMNDKHMQGVARGHHPRGIENVARRPAVAIGLNAQRVVTEQGKRVRRIEQGHIDAAQVGRTGDQIVVAGIAQQRAARQVGQHRVVLHLAERHQVGHLPAFLLPAAGNDGAPDIVQFLPIPALVPMASGIGQILIVVFQRVVPVVEQVLAVQLDHRKHTDQKNR